MTAVVLVLLTLCVCFGIRSYAKKRGRAAAAAANGSPAEKKVRVADPEQEPLSLSCCSENRRHGVCKLRAPCGKCHQPHGRILG